MREKELPTPTPLGAFILPGQRKRLRYGTITCLQITMVYLLCPFELTLQRLDKGIRKYGTAILATFRMPDHELISSQHHILHS